MVHGSNLPVDIGRIVGRPVTERRGSPLVAKNPDFLRCEVEKRGSNSRALHVDLASGGHVGPVLEQAGAEGAISAVVDPAAVHEVLSFVGNMSEVLE